MGKHLEQASAFCVCPPVPNRLIKADKDKIEDNGSFKF